MEKVIFIFNGVETILSSNKEQPIKEICQKFASMNNININFIHFSYEGNIIDINLKLIDIIKLYNIKITNNYNHISIKVEKNNTESDYFSKYIECPKCHEKSKNEKCKNGHNIKEKIKELRKKIDVFNNSINEIINVLQKLIINIENYYNINYLNIYEKNENYLKNINTMSQNFEDLNYYNIIKFIEKINKDFNINTKFTKIIKLYNKINSSITLRYKITKKVDKIKIFDSKFVNNNKFNCDIIYNNKNYELCDYFNIKNFNNLEDMLEIKLIGVNNITDMSNMFYRCFSLNSITDVTKWDTTSVTDMSWTFYDCSSLVSLPDISQWNTKNVKNMGAMFYNCSSLICLPDVSNWDTSKVTDMGYMFYNCSNLLYLPDISKWDIRSVIQMRGMFKYCMSLSFLPDFSKWHIDKSQDTSEIFSDCISLSFLPDISNWKSSSSIYNRNHKTKNCINCLNVSNFE